MQVGYKVWENNKSASFTRSDFHNNEAAGGVGEWFEEILCARVILCDAVDRSWREATAHNIIEVIKIVYINKDY